ncbi:MAG: diguanylate cyclase [Desulfohalobiaceae bacterium]|nr:diguanylate cyclase [Desulfohalobiaceae bacterium]
MTETGDNELFPLRGELDHFIQDIPHFELEDILDLERVRELNEAFAHTNGIASTVIDVRGEPLIPPANHSRVCRAIRNTPQGLANCQRSGRLLGEKARKLQRPVHSPCYSLGFVDAAAPIMIQGRHVATWLVGQADLSDVDEDRIVQYAREIGADEQEMLQGVREMRTMSPTDFQLRVDFLWRASQHISDLAYTNLKYSRAISRLQTYQRELNQYKLYLESMIQDRTRDLRYALHQVDKLSKTDALTGCFNRQHLNENLVLELQQSVSAACALSIILCDLDRFKEVNDSRGHQCGDYVLQEVTKRFRSCIRNQADWLARFGGEEFLFVLPETDMRVASSVAERLRRALEEHPITYREESFSITATFGVATYDPNISSPYTTTEGLIRIADQNLYRAKQQGRNRVFCSDPPECSKDIFARRR